ncbi:MAG: UbiD family decarboxylase [Acidaminococcaceae bacterium]
MGDSYDVERVFSLRNWLHKARELNQVKEVKGADRNFEIGTITELNAQSAGKKILSFTEIPGFDPDFGVISGAVLNPQTLGLALNIEACEDKIENADKIAEALREGEQHIKEYPPEFVASGPVMENQRFGDDIDLNIFPAPIWHEEDGGPYIGTGGVQIHQDEDSDWINIGCYRMHLLSKDKIGNYITNINHGNIIRQKYWAKGKPAPVVAIFGMHPVFFALGATTLAQGVSELNMAGALFKQGVPVIKGPVTGLPIPADAEIAVEGYVYPNKTMMEGSFGEFTGYYGGGAAEQPYIDVKGLYYRNKAIILGAAPSIPPHDFSFISSSVRAAALKEDLRKAGIPGVRGVWPLEVGGSRAIIVTSLKQAYDGHANQALLVSAGCHAGSLMARYAIVVDDDINPSDINQVMWAVATRTNPASDIDVVRRTFTLPMDPMVSTEDKEKGRIYTSRALINACIPFERLKSFPKVVVASPEKIKEAKEKWGYLWK